MTDLANNTTLPHPWAGLAGEWTGVKHLWLDPDEPDASSPSLLTVTLDPQRPAFRMAYTWKYDGKNIAGILDVTFGGGVVRSVWTDTFHTAPDQMALEGSLDNDRVTLLGRSLAPPVPDWGWRMVLEPDERQFIVRMFNVAPDGREDRAVEIAWHR